MSSCYQTPSINFANLGGAEYYQSLASCQPPEIDGSTSNSPEGSHQYSHSLPLTQLLASVHSQLYGTYRLLQVACVCF